LAAEVQILGEVPIGPVNGVNKVFVTAKPYIAGSVTVFLNGISDIAGNEDGHVELGNSTIELKVAPLVGDVVQVFYRTPT
jgi:hypothetical protein